MKIVCVMPIYGRRDITLETLKLLQEQTLPLFKIIVVGSTVGDKETADMANVDYINYSNMPLSDKVQAGIYFARQYEPDALLTTGSDTWLTRNFCEVLGVYIKQGAHLVGKTESYSCKANSNESLEILRHRYKRRKDPIGGGRFLSKAALDFINWRVYPLGLNKGLDNYSYAKLTKDIKNIKIVIANKHTDVFSMDIKSNLWKNITPFSLIKRSHYGLYIEIINYPEKWVEEKFPGSLKVLKNIVPNINI